MLFFSLTFRHRCSKTERDAQQFILNVCIQYEVLHFSFNEDRGCEAAACRGEAAEVKERWKQGGWGGGSSFLCAEAAAEGFPGLFLPLSASVSLISASALQFFFLSGASLVIPAPALSPAPPPPHLPDRIKPCGTPLPPSLQPMWRAKGSKQMQRGMKIRI